MMPAVPAVPADRPSPTPEIIDTNINFAEVFPVSERIDIEKATTLDSKPTTLFRSFLTKYHSLVVVLFFGCIIMPSSVVALLICWFFPKLDGERPVKVVGGMALCSLTLLELYFSASFAMTFFGKNTATIERRTSAFAVWAGFTGIVFCVLLTSMLFVSALMKPPK